MQSRVVMTCLFFLGTFVLRSEPPPHYYDTATGKTGAELRAALHAIVRSHHVIPYSSSTKLDTSDALKVLDANPLDPTYVIEIYSGSNAPLSTFGLATGWNREHQWCDSYGLDGAEPAYSDLHNLRACDSNVNSSRGNKYYDTTTTNGTGYAFPAHIEAPLCSTDSDSWEPPRSDRGNIARSLFYMAIRYTGDATNEPHLLLTDTASLIQSSNAYMGKFTTLLKWHFDDPVDASESNRNDLVYSLYQTNRNPFVDHPEWVAAAFIPRLNIQPGDQTTVVLWWTNDYAPSLTLETATVLLGTWSPVPASPLQTPSAYVLLIPKTNNLAFYRLRLE